MAARNSRKMGRMIDYVWTGVVCVLLLAYLVYALLKPEKF
jgi:K+-transporting ATPase KdpF subunit